jgi:hypothetical protein
MKLRYAAILVLTLVATTLNATAADAVKWESAKADITPQGELTVEVTVTVHLDESPGRVWLILQDKDDKPLGNRMDAIADVEPGECTLTLKRTITVPKSLGVVAVWTPLYVGEAKRTGILKVGTLDIKWAGSKPSVKVNMPKR